MYLTAAFAASLPSVNDPEENLCALPPTVSPSYISPIQGLQRLQRIMDEYVGGIATNYMTNANMLKRGLELLTWLEEDLENVGAEDYHQLMRAWELKHRALTSQCVTEHTMFREEI